jgi:hypothetical protein
VSSLRGDALRDSSDVEGGHQAVSTADAHDNLAKVLAAALEGDVQLLEQRLGTVMLHDAADHAVEPDALKDVVDRTHLRRALGLHPGRALLRKTLRPALGKVPVLVDIGEFQLATGQPEPVVSAKMPGEADIGRAHAKQAGRLLSGPAVLEDHAGGDGGPSPDGETVGYRGDGGVAERGLRFVWGLLSEACS